MTVSPPEALRRVDYLTPAHQALNIARVLAAHFLLAGFFVFLSDYPLWAGILPALAASWIHQRFASEMAHEAAHYNLLQDKTWNDRAANFLLTYLHGYNIGQYRKAHMHHHAQKEFFSPNDPDTAHLNVTTKKELWLCLLRDVSGYTALRNYWNIVMLGRGGQAQKSGDVIYIFCLHLALLTASVIAGVFAYYFLYMASLVTLYSVMNRLRTYGQHLHISSDGSVSAGGSPSSRTTRGGILDRLFFSSDLMNFHHEHHARPHLPYRALAAACGPVQDDNRYMENGRWKLLLAFYKSLK